MFLGLRMNEGVEWEALRAEFGEELMGGAVEALGDVEEAGLVIVEGGRVKLTARGRMASNEVFSRLLVSRLGMADPVRSPQERSSRVGPRLPACSIPARGETSNTRSGRLTSTRARPTSPR